MRRHSTIPVLLVLLVPLGYAHGQSAPGCGPSNVQFDVKTGDIAPGPPSAPSGKALVYFLQDDLKYKAAPRPTTRFGIDGTWVGATHANSYFYVFVDPGEHHVCANWQSDRTPFYIGEKRATAAYGFVAQAGNTYYFRAKDIVHTGQNGTISSRPEVELAPVDSDEAQAIMQSFSFSSSKQKK